MYIPDGFHTVNPYILARDAEKLVSFLRDTFDAQETLRTLRPNGKIANVQIRMGNSTLMISEETASYKSMTSSFYVFVEDVDNSYRKAISNGATSEMKPSDMPYGDRNAGVVDEFGNIWWLAKRLVKEPYKS